MTDARAILDRAMTEAAWLAQVIELAVRLGYLYYHTHDSRRSPQGFPDLVLVRPARHGEAGRLVFMELKVQGRPLRPAQQRWADSLRAAGQEVYAPAWPSHWDEIERMLR